MAETGDAHPLPKYIAARISEFGITGVAHTESVMFVHALQTWTGDADAALAWFSAQPLPSFGGRTAADLVREGRLEAVKGYVERISAGGFA